MLRRKNYVSVNELIVNMYLSTYCNFACPYCYLNHHETKKDCSMTRQYIKAVMDALSKSKHKVNLCILGGEPTIVDTFHYTLDLALNEPNIKTIDVFTNGTTKLNDIDGVHYTISIHPYKFNEKSIANFKDVSNKLVKVMIDVDHLDRTKNLINCLISNGITPVADYICKFGDFSVTKDIIHEIELIPTHEFNGKDITTRDIILQNLWDARKFKCFQNELSIAPDGEIRQFCDDFKTYDLNYLKNFSIKLTQCKFEKCECFDQVKI